MVNKLQKLFRFALYPTGYGYNKTSSVYNKKYKKALKYIKLNH